MKWQSCVEKKSVFLQKKRMKYIDLSEYGKTFKKPKRVLQHRGLLDSDSSDMPHQIANKFIRNYCDYGLSLCFYEPLTEDHSFYSFLLVKDNSVLNDKDVRRHKTLYQQENHEFLDNLLAKEGRQIKEFISYNETRKQACEHFVKYIQSSLNTEDSIYYWVKLDTNVYNIPLAKEFLKSRYINAVNMPNEANILILTPQQENEETGE